MFSGMFSGMSNKILKVLLGLLILTVVLTGLTPQSWSAMLPPRPEMEKRLIQVLDEPRVRAEYYPLLLNYAGMEKTPQQVVNIFRQSLEQFLGTMSPSEAQLVRVQLVNWTKPFLLSVLSDSPDETQRAVEILFSSAKV